MFLVKCHITKKIKIKKMIFQKNYHSSDCLGIIFRGRLIVILGNVFRVRLVVILGSVSSISKT